MAYKVDVSSLASVESLRDAALQRFGAVHLLCNNAGVWIGALMQDADIKDWQYLINVNLYGVIHGVKAFLPLLVKQGEGHIVNTASMGGLISGPPEGLYTTTKFAVVGLSEALLMEVADKGVGVSVLCPGLVNTNLITQSFAVRPEDLNPGIDHRQPAPMWPAESPRWRWVSRCWMPCVKAASTSSRTTTTAISSPGVTTVFLPRWMPTPQRYGSTSGKVV